jgi:hypothetical protein
VQYIYLVTGALLLKIKNITIVKMSSGGGAIGISSVSNNLAESTIESIERDQKSSSEEPEISVEKGGFLETSTRVDTQEEIAHLLSNEDPFPEDPDAEIETQQFTFRAVLVGCILGGVIAASK